MLVGGMKRASRNREAEVHRYKGGEDVPLDAMCQGDKLAAAASGLESMTALWTGLRLPSFREEAAVSS